MSLWWEGANPYQVSNNQGIESKNLEIKEIHSFRERLEMGSFCEMVENIVRDNSSRDDTLLCKPRVEYLMPDVDGNKRQDSFRRQEEGYQYYIENLKKLPNGKRKPGNQVEVVPDGKFTICDSKDVQLGKVTKLIVLKSSANTLTDHTLVELAKMRIEKREKPIYKSLHDFFVIRNSCHIIEVVGNEYYCDCKIGIKVDYCKHVMTLMYDRENFPINPRLRSVKLGRKKRGVGRPSKVGPALSKSPPRNMVDIENFTEIGCLRLPD